MFTPYACQQTGAVASRPLHRLSLQMGGASYTVTAIKYIWKVLYMLPSSMPTGYSSLQTHANPSTITVKSVLFITPTPLGGRGIVIE